MKTATILMCAIIAACTVEPAATSTAEQGMYCDPYCDPDHPVSYMQQAQDAMSGWKTSFCPACSTACSTSAYPNGTSSAICDAIDGDGWLVGQCWVDYRASGPTGNGCQAIPPN